MYHINQSVGLGTERDAMYDGVQTLGGILEQRGVVFFRGLDVSDEQQVAIAKTLGDLVQNEGESGIYKISLDKSTFYTDPDGTGPLPPQCDPLKAGTYRFKDLRRLLGQQSEQKVFAFADNHPLIRDLSVYSNFINQFHSHEQHP